MSRSITGQWRLRRSVRQLAASISTAIDVSNPAASKPKSKPPTPVNKLIALSMLCRCPLLEQN